MHSETTNIENRISLTFYRRIHTVRKPWKFEPRRAPADALYKRMSSSMFAYLTKHMQDILNGIKCRA